MKNIEYRFWNTDYTQKPIMEYGSTDDLKFVERSIGKDKMLLVIEHNGSKYYENDIVSYSDNHTKERIYIFDNLRNCFLTNAIGYELENRSNASCILVGNTYTHPELNEW